MLSSIPNALTILRIALIPVLIVSFYIDGVIARYISVGIFVGASLTDYIDGLLARMWRAETRFGRILDPVADKMLIASTLLMLVHKDIAPVVPAVAILCREIFVSGLRENLAEFKISIPVSRMAKLKTFVQMSSIIILLLGENVVNTAYILIIGKIGIWVAACLTIITGYAYLREGFKYIS